MARIDELLAKALASLPPKPGETATRSKKKAYSEQISKVVAQAFAEELRERGLTGSRPAPPGVVGKSGAERRMAGGIGAKKVDVTWATEESGLIFAVSIKSINFRDKKTGNFQKNLTNRRGDMLFEGVTLHRRFPYAVLAGFFFLDKDAANDATEKRSSTFHNTHKRLSMFTGRDDPAGRDTSCYSTRIRSIQGIRCTVSANQTAKRDSTGSLASWSASSRSAIQISIKRTTRGWRKPSN